MTRNPFEELEEMVERISRQAEEGITGGPSLHSTPVDVRDEPERLVVQVDLPGFSAEEIDLQLSDRTLDVRAERDSETEQREGNYVRRERKRGSVSRSIRLPEPVDEDGVTASLDDGVLTVSLEKERDEGGQRIEIDD